MTAPAGSSGGGSLSGIRVLDLSRVLAGPYCAQMLGDHGAEVIKVEPPAGDETRTWGPPFLAGGSSAYFANLNRNKKNVVLDLSTERGREVLGSLLAWADVAVENFKAGTLAGWGLPDEEIERLYPELVHCRITGFGTDGPSGGMPGYDAVLQAFGGLMSVTGESGGPPVRVGTPVVDQVTGVLAFSGVLLALRERAESGRGQLVDCSLLDTVISLMHPHSAAWLTDGTVGGRTGTAHPSIAPYESFETADGPLFVGAANDRQFRLLVEYLELPELLGDERFASNPDRVHNSAALREILGARIRRYGREGIARSLMERGVPAAPVHDVGEALTDPQVLHRDMVVERDGYRGTGVPVKLSRTPGEVREAPRPAGSDTRAVLASLGYSEEDIAAMTPGFPESP